MKSLKSWRMGIKWIYWKILAFQCTKKNAFYYPKLDHYNQYNSKPNSGEPKIHIAAQASKHLNAIILLMCKSILELSKQRHFHIGENSRIYSGPSVKRKSEISTYPLKGGKSTSGGQFYHCWPWKITLGSTLMVRLLRREKTETCQKGSHLETGRYERTLPRTVRPVPTPNAPWGMLQFWSVMEFQLKIIRIRQLGLAKLWRSWNKVKGW